MVSQDLDLVAEFIYDLIVQIYHDQSNGVVILVLYIRQLIDFDRELFILVILDLRRIQGPVQLLALTYEIGRLAVGRIETGLFFEMLKNLQRLLELIITLLKRLELLQNVIRYFQILLDIIVILRSCDGFLWLVRSLLGRLLRRLGLVENVALGGNLVIKIRAV